MTTGEPVTVAMNENFTAPVGPSTRMPVFSLERRVSSLQASNQSCLQTRISYRDLATALSSDGGSDDILF